MTAPSKRSLAQPARGNHSGRSRQSEIGLSGPTYKGLQALSRHAWLRMNHSGLLCAVRCKRKEKFPNTPLWSIWDSELRALSAATAFPSCSTRRSSRSTPWMYSRNWTKVKKMFAMNCGLVMASLNIVLACFRTQHNAPDPKTRTPGLVTRRRLTPAD